MLVRYSSALDQPRSRKMAPSVSDDSGFDSEVRTISSRRSTESRGRIDGRGSYDANKSFLDIDLSRLGRLRRSGAVLATSQRRTALPFQVGGWRSARLCKPDEAPNRAAS